ncbi:MAG: VWA domain-containing protein [Kiritimatiellae bacterium]|nr:VWA domain-containing protein [Kiritimatiellia bacterium]
MKRTLSAGILLVALLALDAYGSGMLIPKDESIPPLAIKHQRVRIQIKNGAGDIHIEQVFQNSVDRDLEATYVFPLPEDASIGEFAMYINGKRMSGELVEKDKARRIYEDIVRRMRDPGLLEHMGGRLFRMRVYPVPRLGEQRIEISYSQALPYEAGLYKLVYPLKTAERASRTLDDFTVSAQIRSTVPIKNVYSPSHKVGISRKGEHEATIGFEEDKSVLDRDFVLYYGVSEKAFGLNLLTHAVKDEDGFFMMLLSPEVAPPKDQVIHRDIAFVIDTSGSMAGDKMRQAREALKYCVNRLNEGDRFNVIRFSTDVDALDGQLLAVNDENRKMGLAFVEKMTARGGTDIGSALLLALGAKRDAQRPYTIVFLTDGKPTIGETDPEQIVANVAKNLGARTRLFVFGVGEKVNIHLLDKLSGQHGGTSQYVKPDEDIEMEVSAFYDKISHPVLTEPKVVVEKLQVKHLHPQALPNLFSGGQLTLFGRYAGDGHVAIRLTGEVNGQAREFVYEADFPARNADNDFIPRLWATRRVGYLLDQIRLHGEEQELKDEVLRLSQEYGIMTPYTSYLVLEDDKAYETHGVARRERVWKSGFTASGRAAAPAPTRGAEPAASAPVPVFEADAGAAPEALSVQGVSGKAQVVGGRDEEVRDYFSRQDGADAIELSETIERYKQKEDASGRVAANVRHVGGKIFYLVNGVWVDRDYKKGMKETKVAYASEAYFKLLAEKPELKKYLALGEKVIVCVDAERAVVVEPAD